MGGAEAHKARLSSTTAFGLWRRLQRRSAGCAQARVHTPPPPFVPALTKRIRPPLAPPMKSATTLFQAADGAEPRGQSATPRSVRTAQTAPAVRYEVVHALALVRRARSVSDPISPSTCWRLRLWWWPELECGKMERGRSIVKDGSSWEREGACIAGFRGSQGQRFGLR